MNGISGLIFLQSFLWYLVLLRCTVFVQLCSRLKRLAPISLPHKEWIPNHFSKSWVCCHLTICAPMLITYAGLSDVVSLDTRAGGSAFDVV